VPTRSGFQYNDLREWIAQVDKLGELRQVKNATWQQDIGLINEVVAHKRGSPAVLADDIPGHPSGFRVLFNPFYSYQRLALALGLPQDVDLRTLLKFWRDRIVSAKPIEPVCVDHGPILENVMTGEDVDMLKFPTPVWHQDDGGRYFGTASADITRDPETGHINRARIA
jgi:UbiD family decarboxylase